MLHWSSLSHPSHWRRAPHPRHLWPAVGFMLVTSVLGVVVALTFLSSADSISKVEKAQAQSKAIDVLQGYINVWRQQDDPFVTLPNGAQAKSSNVNGVEVGGTRYYYSLTNEASFDPVRLGKVTDYEVISVLAPNAPGETVIYRIK